VGQAVTADLKTSPRVVLFLPPEWTSCSSRKDTRRALREPYDNQRPAQIRGRPRSSKATVLKSHGFPKVNRGTVRLTNPKASFPVDEVFVD